MHTWIATLLRSSFREDRMHRCRNGQRIRWARERQREGGRTTSVNAKAISDVAIDAGGAVRSGEDVTLPLICTYGTERLWFETTTISVRLGQNGHKA